LVNFSPLTKKLWALMLTHPSALPETTFQPLGDDVASNLYTCYNPIVFPVRLVEGSLKLSS